MTKIIGIGNALVDILVHLEDESLLQQLHLPKGGMTLIDRAHLAAVSAAIASLPHHRSTGGCASNTVHALASLGDVAGYIGCVGADEAGTFFRQQAAQRGIDAHLATIPGEATGVATTLITPDGERTFATYLGAAARVGAAELLAMTDFADPAAATSLAGSILHVEGYLVQNHDAIEQVLRTAKSSGMKVSYDLASWNIVQADRAFIHHLVAEYVDIVFANEEEAAAFSGQADAEEALHRLAQLTEVAVVKVGKRGALGCRGTEQAYVPVQPRTPVDTTAAGDFFAAGFLHAIIRECTLATCLDCGNRMAAEVIQVEGTQVCAERLRAAIVCDLS